MEEDSLPTGQRFSQVYLRPNEVLRDTGRGRKRISALFEEITDRITSGHEISIIIKKEIKKDIGVEVSNPPNYRGPPYLYTQDQYNNFFEYIEVEHLLDSITVIYKFLCSHRPKTHIYFREEVSKIFSEECWSYTIDEDGGVHYAIDEQFEYSTQATIYSLQSKKFASVRSNFEDALNHLDTHKPKTTEAVLLVFLAVEGMAKLWVGNKISRLGIKEIQKYIRPKIEAAYGADANATKAAMLLVNGIEAWTNTANQYRHAQESEEHSPTPRDLAIAFVSQGASYLRWMAGLMEK